MHQERREFLKQLAAACAAGFTRNIGFGTALTGTYLAVGSSPAAAASAASTAGIEATATVATAAQVGTSIYGSGVRAQVFEVIVRQGIAGAPWKEICAGPLKVNGISEEEVEKEMARRKSLLTGAERNKENLLLEAHRLHKEKLAAIKHSEKSPCACNACVLEVYRIRDLRNRPS